MRQALSFGPSGVPAAVNYIGKSEAHKALIKAVSQAFERHVRINWNLVIQVNERNPVKFGGLAELVTPKLAGDLLESRAEELEDLFRRLCCEKNQIKLDRVLWHQEGRVALAVLAFTHGKAPESLLIVCGESAAIREETRRYHEFRPEAPGETGTVLVKSSETLHFAGNAYALAGADLEDVCSLFDLYHRGPEKAFNLALDGLFDKTLVAWHRGKRVPEETKAVGQLYVERLGLDADRFSVEVLEERVRALVRQAPAIGAKIKYGLGKLTFDFEGQSYSYPDPAPFFHQNRDRGETAVLIQTPGTLSGDNILTDGKGRTWLTEFARAGLAPTQWNFAALEAAIRFDWIDVKNLRWLYQMEQLLIADGPLKLYVSDLEVPLRKPMRAIEVIRRFALRQTAGDWLHYHVGIFFQAARRMADFNPNYRLASSDLARMAHALIAAALIAKYVGHRQASFSPGSRPEAIGLRIDTANQEVWVGGNRVTLSKQSYILLCKLNEHADKLCTRRELVEGALGEKYDEGDESQEVRLNTAVRRLREKIEDDPDEPRYILTEFGRGYRLVPGLGKSRL